MSGRKFRLELLVDSVTVNELPNKDSILTRDVRLSIALSEFPVVHIKPSPVIVQSPSLGETVLFGGAGKLCEFSLPKSQLASATLSVLFLKEVPSINDHLILCMTPPMSFRELILSLPSCSPQPYVKRQFQFIDNRGTCDIFVRISADEPEVIQKTSRLFHTVTPKSRSRPKTAIEHSPAKSPRNDPLITSPKGKRSPAITYGGLRKRVPIIH